ncbi:hypothetical protein CYY_001872 [Polysphondylium violaceum]|uniref:Ubiquitin thioesterase OTU n=1 Tax=Polysphondylium violaceum TaxID=133409 RepID=A0A8J4VA72_9MYCE|nr:hypothetical protein CYY_001872 [Polysphondylium violaceum]
MINLRVRSKTGVENLRLESSLPLFDFQNLIQQKTNIPNTSQKILYGFPPKALDLSNSSAPISTYLANGDTLTVEDVATATQSQPQYTYSQPTTNNQGTHQPSSSSNSGGGYAIRRKTEDDNSCLFSAVAYVLENKNRGKGMSLRNIIAKNVRENPYTFNEGVLGQTNEEYCRWIQNPKNWGGAIELSILCNHYKTEIGAFDISTKILYCYGEDQNYAKRVYLLYDGIHYDALSMSQSPYGSESSDTTIFSRNDENVLKKFKKFVEDENKAGKFTDTSNFTLLCLDCNKTLKGEKEAALHAGQTGHGNFSEYKK